ncbi:MAG TPA: NUDIX hydrolase N-terminal domain-containing protein [Chloroflexota bacterium]|nr:NUDIX hydrolase N-terminal domain-containing protein [Chloroflexota bacterium]
MACTEPDRAGPDAALIAGWADELQAMAAIGLLYGHDHFDRERYARIQIMAAEMLAAATGAAPEAARTALARDIGYVTVKVGVAGAVFDQAGRLLLLQRRDSGLWAMPGGWADVGTDTPTTMTVREVREETGMEVRVDRLLGLYDSRRRRFGHPHHLYHLVFACAPTSGGPRVTEESLAIDWFTPERLPALAASHVDAVRDAFQRWANPTLPTVFD